MTTTPEKKARQMPKGGRKGGSVFPRTALKDAVTYARKLVSKTHTAPQPKDVILSGVIGAKGGTGEVRMSALKQYGFLMGDAKVNFSADTLAKKITAAPTEELIPLYREAALKPTIFKKIFETFHGDTVSKAKLKQRAADLKVHPDETTTCVDLYVASMATAELVTVDGEQVTHLASSDVSKAPPTTPAETTTETTEEESTGEEALEAEENGGEESPEVVDVDKTATKGQAFKRVDKSGQRAVFNVNVTLDSSLDFEKLQRQLELLKRFGVI